MKISRRGWAVVLGATLAAVLVARALGTPQGRALIKTTRAFAPLETDPRVHFEPGAEASAADIAALLDRTLDRVQRAHGVTFEGPVTIFVCATQESFNEFLAQPGGRATGTVVLGRLLLSPRSFREGTYEAVLGHELSHLLLRRRRGWISAVTEVPGWFHEGLGVWASGGGGALPVSEGAARRAIAAGPTFAPEDEGAWRPRMAADHGVQHHMFYRQAGLFVGFLAKRDPEGFRGFLRGLHEGEEFGVGFAGHLGEPVAEAWGEFVEAVRTRSPEEAEERAVAGQASLEPVSSQRGSGNDW